MGPIKAKRDERDDDIIDRFREREMMISRGRERDEMSRYHGERERDDDITWVERERDDDIKGRGER